MSKWAASRQLSSRSASLPFWVLARVSMHSVGSIPRHLPIMPSNLHSAPMNVTIRCLLDVPPHIRAAILRLGSRGRHNDQPAQAKDPEPPKRGKNWPPSRCCHFGLSTIHHTVYLRHSNKFKRQPSSELPIRNHVNGDRGLQLFGDFRPSYLHVSQTVLRTSKMHAQSLPGEKGMGYIPLHTRGRTKIGRRFRA